MADEPGVVAIVRLRHQPAPIALLHALRRAGIRRLEITLPTPQSRATIEQWRAADEAVLVGAGTIRTASDARSAIDSGARFLVTPTTDPAVVRTAASAGVPVACGALTPTEIERAATAGAQWVKVFPVEAMGGPAYIAAIRAPLPDIALLPTGGVDAVNAREYARLGCAGVGVGSTIVDEDLVRREDWRVIEDRARTLIEAWETGSGDA